MLVPDIPLFNYRAGSVSWFIEKLLARKHLSRYLEQWWKRKTTNLIEYILEPILGIVCWQLWKQKNPVYFSATIVSMEGHPVELLQVAMTFYVYEFVRCVGEDTLVAHCDQLQDTLWIKWLISTTTWILHWQFLLIYLLHLLVQLWILFKLENVDRILVK